MNNDELSSDMSDELALQLFAMRDSLTRAAMALRDMQFVLDRQGRRLAQETTNEILERHGRDPDMQRSEDRA